jgi:hypothetical protein
MSSETSTDAQPLASRPVSPRTRGKDAGLQPWQLFILAGLISASAVAFRASSQPSSVRVALIVTVFGAAAMGIAALRALIPLTSYTGFVEPPIVGSRTRVALEREKMLALRTIKELEFDRAMGKVSEKDFAEMSARLRARAARILSDLDARSGHRDDIEREIARRLGAPESGQPRVEPQPDDRAQDASAADPSTTSVCEGCGTRNDADARFCKSCGHRMEAE